MLNEWYPFTGANPPKLAGQDRNDYCSGEHAV